MRRLIRPFLLLIIAALVLGSIGCKTNSGSREFIPGKGWRPIK